MNIQVSSVQTFRLPMNHSTPGLPVHHKLPEFTQTHAHRVGDEHYIHLKEKVSCKYLCVLKSDKYVTQNMPFAIRTILSFQHSKNNKYRKVILISTFLLKTGVKNCQVKDALLVP